MIHTQEVIDAVLKFSNKLCMFSFLQKLLYRNQEHSIQLFIVIIQKPSFCVAFFYNKKILFSFYCVCYLLENDTLIQELFGGRLDKVLGTDNDDSEVDFDVIACKVFRASIQIIDIKSEVVTCDGTMHVWDAPAENILENILGDEEEKQELDNEGNKNLCDTIVPDFLTAIKNISAVKKFAINNGMSATVTDLASAETAMERKFLQGINNATQTFVTDYF